MQYPKCVFKKDVFETFNVLFLSTTSITRRMCEGSQVFASTHKYTFSIHDGERVHSGFALKLPFPHRWGNLSSKGDHRKGLNVLVGIISLFPVWNRLFKTEILRHLFFPRELGDLLSEWPHYTNRCREMGVAERLTCRFLLKSLAASSLM